MRSSIFSSEKPVKAHIVLVLALCALFCLSVEVVTAYFFGRVSRIESRREGEYRQAMAVRSGKPRGKLSVLVAGNSLLLHGVDFPELQRELGPEVELHRVVFEDTSYLDWFYGLNHIFRQGARPDVVVLLLSPVQLTDDTTEGDYGAHMLVDHRDILSYARDVGADRNRTSVLALDNLSFFFGTRTEVRTWILGKLLPDLPRLTRYFRGNSDAPAYSVPVEVATSRLARLRATCGRYGAAFVLTVPPTRTDSPADTRVVETAGASLGVPVLVPVDEGVLPQSDYADLVHLNPHGAARFTPLFAGRLRQFVSGGMTAQAATASATQPSASLRVTARETEGGQLTSSPSAPK
jgi:hypothetical protein